MITIPATYNKGVILPTKKITQKQLQDYDLVISLIPKKDNKTLIDEWQKAYKKWEYVVLPKSPTKKTLSKILWS